VSFRITSTKMPVFSMNSTPSSTVTFNIGRCVNASYTGTGSTFTTIYSVSPTLANAAYFSSNGTLTGNISIAEGDWIRISVSGLATSPLTTGVGAKVYIYPS
jgi:hypothetical protein